jgi:hypothetical protein
MARPLVIAAVVGVAVIGLLATLAGFISFTTDPESEKAAPAPEPQTLCAYLEHLLDRGPLPREQVVPTAVINDPRLGDPVASSIGVESPDTIGEPGPNGAAATYIIAQDGLISTTDVVTIPDSIAGDYDVYATELYRLVFREPGSNGAPSAEAVAAATRLDEYLATC